MGQFNHTRYQKVPFIYRNLIYFHAKKFCDKNVHAKIFPYDFYSIIMSILQNFSCKKFSYNFYIRD